MANAVLDGADALMLSAETSVGQWPTEAVRTMDRVIATTEQGLVDTIPVLERRPTERGDAMARAAAAVGSTTNASALVAFTGPERRRAGSPRCDTRCRSSCSPLTSRCSVS